MGNGGFGVPGLSKGCWELGSELDLAAGSDRSMKQKVTDLVLVVSALVGYCCLIDRGTC